MPPLECSIQDRTLKVKGLARLPHVHLLLEALEQLDAVDGTVFIDLSGTNEMDTAGIQILTAFALDRPPHAPVRLRHPSPSLIEALALLGLDSLLSAA